MELTARDLMTSPVICARESMTIGELTELLRTRQISGVPVVDDQNRLVGVISITDLIALSAEFPAEGSLRESDFHTSPAMDNLAATGDLLEPDAALSDYPVSAFMSRRVITTSEDTPLGEVAGLLLSHRIHRLIIVRGEEIAGIVTVRDLLRAVHLHFSRSPAASSARPQESSHAEEETARPEVASSA